MRQVVVILSDIFKVVVFSAGPDAFLGIDRAVIITASGSKENVLELGHPGIGEEQSRVVMGNHRCTADEAVSALIEK